MKSTHLLRALCGAVLALATLGAGCQAEMRKDGSPEVGEEKPLSDPPKPGEPYFELGEVPKGAPVAEGFTPEQEGDEAGTRQVAAPEPVDRISRASLVDFVKNGPRHPLQMVEIQPAFRGAEFVGYRITAFSEEGAMSFGSALRAGDVVIAVNERNIALPEDYMAAWASLKTCDKLSVRLIRGGEQLDMSWPVVD